MPVKVRRQWHPALARGHVHPVCLDQQLCTTWDSVQRYVWPAVDSNMCLSRERRPSTASPHSTVRPKLSAHACHCTWRRYLAVGRCCSRAHRHNHSCHGQCKLSHIPCAADTTTSSASCRILMRRRDHRQACHEAVHLTSVCTAACVATAPGAALRTSFGWHGTRWVSRASGRRSPA